MKLPRTRSKKLNRLGKARKPERGGEKDSYHPAIGYDFHDLAMRDIGKGELPPRASGSCDQPKEKR